MIDRLVVKIQSKQSSFTVVTWTNRSEQPMYAICARPIDLVETEILYMYIRYCRFGKVGTTTTLFAPLAQSKYCGFWIGNMLID